MAEITVPKLDVFTSIKLTTKPLIYEDPAKVKDAAKPTGTTEETKNANTPAASSNNTMIIIIVAVVVLLGAAILVFVLMKKKK